VVAASEVVAFAKRNEMLTVVVAGAGVMLVYLAVRGGGGQAAAPAPVAYQPPLAYQPPAPVGDPGAGGGGGSDGGGIDLAALVAALSSSQQSGADSGVGLGMAGLQAGVDLGSAGLQTGAFLGSAGLQVGSDLGQAAMFLAGDVTGYLGSALEVSVLAQAGQTGAVTGGLVDLLKSLIAKGSLVPAKPGQPKVPKPIRPGSGGSSGSRGTVAPTTRASPPSSSIKTKPGTPTPVGHLAIPVPKPSTAKPAPRPVPRPVPSPIVFRHTRTMI
jgi:hypothetical protein